MIKTADEGYILRIANLLYIRRAEMTQVRTYGSCVRMSCTWMMSKLAIGIFITSITESADMSD